MSRATIGILLALWLGAMGASGLSLMAEPTGDGFVRGLNRVTGFLGWQLAAAILSLPLWLGTRRLPIGDLRRWVGRIPGWWSVGLLVGLGLLTGWAMLFAP